MRTCESVGTVAWKCMYVYIYNYTSLTLSTEHTCITTVELFLYLTNKKKKELKKKKKKEEEKIPFFSAFFLVLDKMRSRRPWRTHTLQL